MSPDFFKLSSYGYLGQVNLSEYLTVPEAQEERPSKRKKKTLDPKIRQEIKHLNRNASVYELQEVVRTNRSCSYRPPQVPETPSRSIQCLKKMPSVSSEGKIYSKRTTSKNDEL